MSGKKAVEPRNSLLGRKCTCSAVCRSTGDDGAKLLAQQCELVVWWASGVEIRSAIARLHRTGQLQDKMDALNRLLAWNGVWIEVSPSDALRSRAELLLEVHPLRAADSLQLAAALSWCEGDPSGSRFICSDIRLCEAAAREGFAVVQP